MRWTTHGVEIAGGARVDVAIVEGRANQDDHDSATGVRVAAMVLR